MKGSEVRRGSSEVSVSHTCACRVGAPPRAAHPSGVGQLGTWLGTELALPAKPAAGDARGIHPQLHGLTAQSVIYGCIALGTRQWSYTTMEWSKAWCPVHSCCSQLPAESAAGSAGRHISALVDLSALVGVSALVDISASVQI